MSTSLDRITHEREIVAWFEIPAINFERAVQFYRSALSLKVQVVLLNGMKHGIIRNRFSDPRGSIVESSVQGNGSGTLIYFRSQIDVSHTLENVKGAGGEIVIPKTLIKDSMGNGFSRIPYTLIDNKIGYYATFLDTEGNKVAIYGNS